MRLATSGGSVEAYCIAVHEHSFVAKPVCTRTITVLRTGDAAEISFHAEDASVFGANTSTN